MANRKSIIILLWTSIFLVVCAIIIQLSCTTVVLNFLISILLGIATGILATTVALLTENIYKVKELYMDYEKSVCKMLNNIYQIASVDLQKDYETSVKRNRDSFINEWENRKNILYKLRKMLHFYYARKIKSIDEKIGCIFPNMQTFFYPHFHNTELTDKDIKIRRFESLKLIKTCRNFNPQEIFSTFENSKNNRIKKDFDANDLMAETLFGLVYFPDMEKDTDYEEAYVSYNNYYAKCDLNATQESVKNIPIQDWSWHTYYSRKTKKEIDKIDECGE